MSDRTVAEFDHLPPADGVRLLCRFGWHDWSPWAAPQNYEYGVTFRQGRKCLCCGRAQLRKFSAYSVT